jgi:hypothetical protein
MARSRRRRRSAKPSARRAAALDTSQPTGRAAYADTRAWLLRTHGRVCAYCGLDYPARDLTLDHVTPRRGQSAYDRRDNLVLACKRCNAGKGDKPFLAWVLGARARAVHLYHYGQHLSDGILEMLRPIVGDERPTPRPPRAESGADRRRKARPRPKRKFGPRPDDDDPSPYLDG